MVVGLLSSRSPELLCCYKFLACTWDSCVKTYTLPHIYEEAGLTLSVTREVDLGWECQN